MGMLLTITIPGSEERTVALVQELVTLLRKIPRETTQVKAYTMSNLLEQAINGDDPDRE